MRTPWFRGVCSVALLAGCPSDDSAGSSEAGSATGSSSQTVSSSDSASSDGTASSSDSASGSSSDSASSGTSGGDDTGIRPGDNCEVASDCAIDDDCCHCGVYQDQIPDGHGCAVDQCDETTCEANGLGGAAPLCLNGNCLLPKVSCDPAQIQTCDVVPDCSEGTAGEIVDGCYTGRCIPLSSCAEAAYFGCEECGPSDACVRFSACSGDACFGVTACIPVVGDAPTSCAEGGDILCGFFAAPHPCLDQPNGGFLCCGGDAETCASVG